ncbi:MAG: sigma 54-interacting transcriptional regulator [bacterium]
MDTKYTKYHIRTFLFCCFLVLTAQPVRAQIEEKVIFQEFYRFHAGDDIAWAYPEFDDSDWEQIDIHTFPRDVWPGIGWFRLVLEVDSTLWDVPLGLRLQVVGGAAEFYLDGQLLHRWGRVGGSKEQEEPYIDVVGAGYPGPRVISFRAPAGTVKGKSRHVVAIRYSNFFLESPVWSGFPAGFDFTIDDLDRVRAQRENFRRRLTIHQILLMGVSLAFALLHFLLFLYYPRLRPNLYFAAHTTFFALTVYFWFQLFFITEPANSVFVLIVRNTAFTLTMLSFIRLTYSLIYPRLPRLFIAFFLIGSSLTVWGWFRPLMAETYLIIFYMAASVEILRALAAAWLRKRKLLFEGSWIILLGMIPLALTAAYWFLIALEVVPEPWVFEEFPTPLYAILILMISMSVFLSRSFARISSRLEAQTKELAFQVGEKTRAAEALQNALSEVERLKNRLHAENVYLQDEIKLQHNFGEIITCSEALKCMLRKVEQVASTDTTVLILGETGTGKELVARAVHSISARGDRPLVKVNCAALPATLIESELFGHEKGAFTGALSRKIGRFELADGGTIFLDEIGDLPPELQAKLLRVLQEGEIERLGSVKTLTVNVRVIAATNRELEQEIENGHFREDLYYRLNVFPITCPPLREHKEDIPLLVNHFIKKYGARSGKRLRTITQTAMDRLRDYHWPGNVRELENIIERAVIISQGKKLELGDWLPITSAPSCASPISTLEETERNHIIEALELTGWRVSGEKGAAKILGIKSTTLDARMKKLGITRDK